MIAPVHGVIAVASQAATGVLAATLWQGVLLAGAAALGLRLLPKTPAPVRFAIWFAVFLLVAGLPFLPRVGGHVGDGAATSSHPWLTLDARWGLWIAALWAAVSVVRGITLLIAAWRVRSLWKRARAVETSLPGLARGAQVCVSDEVDRPTVIGFLAPKIVLPDWLMEKLSAAELEQVVLHEAGHLARRDDWLNLLQKMALVVFPLNPALAWVERRLCFERELACDEQVLRATGSPKAYAECLASLAEHRLARRGLVRELALALGALGTMGRSKGRTSELAQRVLRILSGGASMKPGQARLVLCGAMLVLVFAAGALERSPQIVGFADSQANGAASSVQEGSVPRARGPEPAVVAVRARVSPAAQWRAVGDAPPHLAISKKQAVSDQAAISRRGATTRAMPDGSGAGDRVVEAREIARPAGARLIETVATLRQVDGEGAVVVTRLVTVEGYGRLDAGRVVSDAVEAEPPRTNDAAQQGPRFAAVPVQGGWLVFQL